MQSQGLFSSITSQHTITLRYKEPLFFKYYAFNAVLTALYHTENFRAHLIMGYSQNGKILNLSFSCCKMENYKLTESIFSLSIFENSQIQINFNSNNIYYARSLKIADGLLDDMQKNALDLYQELVSNTKKETELPNELLASLSICVENHAEMIRNNSSIENAVPKFIELLTSQLLEERKRLQKTPNNTLKV